MTSKAEHYRVRGPTQSGTTVVTTRCTKGEDKPVVSQRMSRLKLIEASGRSRLICQPSSRTGETPPYGMIGGLRKRRHHLKPGPRLDPTRLPLAEVPQSVIRSPRRRETAAAREAREALVEIGRSCNVSHSTISLLAPLGA